MFVKFCSYWMRHAPDHIWNNKQQTSMSTWRVELSQIYASLPHSCVIKYNYWPPVIFVCLFLFDYLSFTGTDFKLINVVVILALRKKLTHPYNWSPSSKNYNNSPKMDSILKPCVFYVYKNSNYLFKFWRTIYLYETKYFLIRSHADVSETNVHPI